jgi:hypothetical protein
MALELPGWLVEAIRYIGYEFPQTNEDVLHQWASSLRELSNTVSSSHGDMTGAVAHLTSNNEGPTIDQVLAALASPDSNLEFLKQFGEGADLAATGVDLIADAVVVMKGIVLFQLAILAPAIAGGPVTFLVKKGVEWAIDRGVDHAVNYFLAGD